MQFKYMRYATVKTVSKPMVGFYFSKYKQKNHIEKQLKHQNETERNAVELEWKRKKKQQPPHGLAINSNKRRCSRNELAMMLMLLAIVKLKHDFTHVYWLLTLNDSSLTRCARFSFSQHCGWQRRKSTNTYIYSIYNTLSSKWCDIPIYTFIQ